jgi:hypothetical protein
MKRKYLHPEKYREFGLTVGLCGCVQENNGSPEKDCEYCYGTGVSVYTNIEIPTPSNCPHWVKDDIYVKGFRCSLYRDVCKSISDNKMTKVISELQRLKEEAHEAESCDYDYGMFAGNEEAYGEAIRLLKENIIK